MVGCPSPIPRDMQNIYYIYIYIYIMTILLALRQPHCQSNQNWPNRLSFWSDGLCEPKQSHVKLFRAYVTCVNKSLFLNEIVDSIKFDTHFKCALA